MFFIKFFSSLHVVFHYIFHYFLFFTWICSVLATVLNWVPEEPLARELQLSPDATSLVAAAFSSLPIERTRPWKCAFRKINYINKCRYVAYLKCIVKSARIKGVAVARVSVKFRIICDLCVENVGNFREKMEMLIGSNWEWNWRIKNRRRLSTMLNSTNCLCNPEGNYCNYGGMQYDWYAIWLRTRITSLVLKFFQGAESLVECTQFRQDTEEFFS